MKRASITKAKNHLSALLDAVRQGETVLILDRNRPIARLEPVVRTTGQETDARIDDLERRGMLRRAQCQLPKSFFKTRLPSPRGKASILEALLSERREGR